MTSMALRLILVASGATAATRVAAFPHDEPLEDQAIRRAAALRRRFSSGERALCGPALRARQTADALGLVAEVDNDLDDCDFGRWKGLRLADLAAAEPDAVAAWLSDPEADVHGGESVATLIRRVSAWLDCQSADDGRIIAVTHASVMRAAVLHALAAPAQSFWRIDIAPLARVEMTTQQGHWTLRSIAHRTKSHALA
jgi:broad specificity phosphatase PhoE